MIYAWGDDYEQFLLCYIYRVEEKPRVYLFADIALFYACIFSILASKCVVQPLYTTFCVFRAPIGSLFHRITSLITHYMVNIYYQIVLACCFYIDVTYVCVCLYLTSAPFFLSVCQVKSHNINNYHYSYNMDAGAHFILYKSKHMSTILPL